LIYNYFFDFCSYTVKPPHSRRVNSERYLVANGFLEEPKKDEKEKEDREGNEENGEKMEGKEGESVQKGADGRLELVVKLLEKIHLEGFTIDTSITSLVPIEWLKNDIQYFYSLSFLFSLFLTCIFSSYITMIKNR
jgi:hypothetical protein